MTDLWVNKETREIIWDIAPIPDAVRALDDPKGYIIQTVVEKSGLVVKLIGKTGAFKTVDFRGKDAIKLKEVLDGVISGKINGDSGRQIVRDALIELLK